MTTLNDLTAEHLGSEATEADVEQYRDWCRELMAREGWDRGEEETVEYLWNDGDYVRQAIDLGLTTPEEAYGA